MNMGKTIVEKIIARKVGVPEVKPGEYVKFGIDTVIQVGSDIGALNANEYKNLGWDKLFDPSKVMIAPEHCGSWSRPQDSITNRESTARPWNGLKVWEFRTKISWNWAE